MKSEHILKGCESLPKLLHGITASAFTVRPTGPVGLYTDTSPHQGCFSYDFPHSPVMDTLHLPGPFPVCP